MSILLMLFLIPLVSSAVVFFLGVLPGNIIKRLAGVLSLLPLALLLYGREGVAGADIDYVWVPQLSIHFHLHIDSLSLVFLYLTSVIIPVSIYAAPAKNVNEPSIFFGFVLMLQGLLTVFFTAKDLVVFTIFWEAMLLPLYFIINIWGGHQRRQAAMQFLIYMIAGSVLMVAGVLALFFESTALPGGGTFNLDALAGISNTAPHAPWICAVFLLAFAVKTPLFPFHAWLPEAYCQASTPGTILLAGILSKAGIYGIVRIGMELFPSLVEEWSPFLLGFAIAGVFYGALAAWSQKDFKRLIAYSSFSHVNFILAGLFIWDQTAHAGAILQALNHGITITALFLAAGWLETRLASTSMGIASGLASVVPHICWLTLAFVLASVALPGTNNFIGELMILFGLFGENRWLAALLGTTVILSVIYMLRWMQQVYFGVPLNPNHKWHDLKAGEFALAIPLAALILWIGLYPAPVLNQIKPAAEKISALATLP